MSINDSGVSVDAPAAPVKGSAGAGTGTAGAGAGASEDVSAMLVASALIGLFVAVSVLVKFARFFFPKAQDVGSCNHYLAVGPPHIAE